MIKGAVLAMMTTSINYSVLAGMEFLKHFTRSIESIVVVVNVLCLKDEINNSIYCTENLVVHTVSNNSNKDLLQSTMVMASKLLESGNAVRPILCPNLMLQNLQTEIKFVATNEVDSPLDDMVKEKLMPFM